MAFNAETVGVYFYLEGDPIYGFRRWSSVPRVGDEVMLGPKDPKTKTKTAYRVTRVVWGVEPDEAVTQEVNIEIKRIK